MQHSANPVDFGDVNSIAENAGRIHGAVCERIGAYLRSNDRTEIARHALDGLVRHKLISEKEKAILGSLTATVITTQRSVNIIEPELREIAHKMRSEGATPAALTVVGIAIDSVERLAAQNGPNSRNAVAHADVEGAIVGGIFGFELGGPVGAGVGMLAGGAASSVAEAL